MLEIQNKRKDVIIRRKKKEGKKERKERRKEGKKGGKKV